MADQPAMPSDTQRPERGNRGGAPRSRGRGGNRRGRGNGNLTNTPLTDDGAPIDQESRRGRGGSGYRGRGGRGGAQPRGQQPSNQPPQPQPLDTTAEAPPPDTAANDSKDAASPTDSENEEICFICANPIQYHSIAPCNHMTCHICSLRMRALYKTKQCPHCRTNSDFVIFTTNPTKTYEEYTAGDIAAQDDPLGIKYEAKQIREDTLVLLRYNCPEPSCDVACLGWPDLHRHVKNTHKLFLCDLCSRFKKVFTHEHTLFTYPALKKHERHGDDVPGAEDQSGFKGHPECQFCHKRFYGDDELYAHCKEAHERCFICDRNNGGRRPQYFINWEALEQHFISEHYRCTDPECLEKKFIVFGSEMDLKAHLIEEHPGSLSKGALKDMRRVDMASFPDARGHGSSAGGPSNRGRGGRAHRDNRRDNQSPEPPPQPPARPAPGPGAPPGRGTLYVQSANSSIPPRQFSRQLTRPESTQESQPVRSGPREFSEPAAGNAGDSFPALGSLSISTPPEPAPARPAAVPANVSTSTAQKHEAVISRATRLANNDNSKLEKFKRYISNYNAEQMSSRDLIEAFWVLFDVRATDLATLLRELSELFDKEEKRRSLLEAWNEWKSVNEDYPPMPGSTSAAGGSTSAARVLKLKSATSRNLHAGASPWSSVTSNTISTGAGSLANINGGGARVGLGTSAVTAAGKGKGKAPAAGSAPWLSAVRSQGQAGSSSGAARPSRAGGVVSKMDFPSLPKVAPKHPPVPRKNEGVAPTSVWGGPSGSGGNGVDDVEGEGVKTKGKGKKKQTIIQWG
ncbi:E3 ubiquitin-protein ligase [Drechslerella dactyloides]|uniref:RING-type E3 ubiquitin transferase n=1 Tax=Drechslerella dactyloides TaxID=74499 RepID=A0AAD6IWQ2_DREDA|nr:E3 ubiquitin-protein ligase [Drechslerella dactyloides]